MESQPWGSNHEYEVGNVVNIEFTDGDSNGPYRKISKASGRKHIVPVNENTWGMTPDDVEPGIEYMVNIIADTRPGAMAGVLKAELLHVSDFGEMQLKKRDEGYRHSQSYPRDRWSLEELQVLNQGQDVIIEPQGRSEGASGGLSPDYWSVWEKSDKPLPFKGGFTPVPSWQEHSAEHHDPVPPEPVAENAPVFKEVEKDVVAAIERFDDNTVRVIDKVCEYVGHEDKLVPSLDKFKHFVIDKRSASILRRGASAFGRRSPLLAVGDTDTSKTSSFERLAAELGLRFYRLNLSGQTDTGEIIGKFVPNDGNQKRKYESLIEGWSDKDENVREKAFKRVGPEAESILREISKRGDTPTKEEAVKIAMANGLNISDGDWVFQYGYLPLAMMRGGMFLVDEVFLAEPQISERMNSALEQVPSLVISENGNLKIGPGGDFEVHPDFWFVGATNASGMVGRAEQSEAFLRRWRDYILLDPPEESDYKDMMVFLSTGKHPKFTQDGITYQMPSAEPIYPSLKTAEMADAIPTLAGFHMDVRKKAHPETGAPTIGRDRQKKGGKYSFTRSTLLSLMDYLQNEKTLDMAASRKAGKLIYVTDLNSKIKQAIRTFYVDPALPEDRQAIIDSYNMKVTGDKKII